MGDRERGVLLRPGVRIPATLVRAIYAHPRGTRVVVDACGFATLRANNLIQYPKRERMRGDWAAIVGGCPSPQ